MKLVISARNAASADRPRMVTRFTGPALVERVVLIEQPEPLDRRYRSRLALLATDLCMKTTLKEQFPSGFPFGLRIPGG